MYGNKTKIKIEQRNGFILYANKINFPWHPILTLQTLHTALNFAESCATPNRVKVCRKEQKGPKNVAKAGIYY